MKEKKMLYGIGIVFLFLATVGFSYAYFTASIVNKEVKDQVVETGTLSLRYVDGAEIVMNNIKPGDTITKTVYVANTGTIDASYNLVWQELNNEIMYNEISIEGTCTRINSTTEEVDGTCDGIDNVPIASNIIKRITNIEPNIIHKYDLKITFINKNEEQNYNQGKKFSGVLGVRESSQFEKDSWDIVATNVRNGNISSYNLGDTKEIDLGNFGTHIVRIANKSTPSECSIEGFSQTACGFVLEFEDIITTHSINSTATNVGGWPGSELYTYLNNDIYNLLPTDLKKIIIDTTVVSGYGSGDTAVLTSTDKLYLLATAEVWEQGTTSTIKSDNARDLTRQLDYYKEKGASTNNFSSAVKMNGDSNARWWLRSASSGNTNGFYVIGSTGGWDDPVATNVYGISPAFRIG